ncbi:hypothetical protein [Sciscionella marina]|uniref:hypothetical protein n=1 Tax=Sciscionella marina TaxID=508770 RepID=UPI00035CCAB1|nr:hypothetical protein [Sciscionella marina]
MKNSTRTIAVTIAAGAMLAGGVATAGIAQAMPSDSNTCAPGDVTAQVSVGSSPTPQDKLFRIKFTAKPGVSCLMTGSPANLAFYSGSGEQLGVEGFQSEPGSAKQVRIDEQHPAEVYVRTPDAHTPGAPATSATFTMPNSGPGIDFKVAWPADLNGPAEVSPVSAPVS